jgi:hypothetical protein
MIIMDKEGNKRIDEVLGSLDGCKRASAPDFFYTRLRERMLARHEEGKKGFPATFRPVWKLKPVYIVSGLLLVLALNLFVFLRGQHETVTADNNLSVQQSIAAEYNLYDINTVYDLNQDK